VSLIYSIPTPVLSSTHVGTYIIDPDESRDQTSALQGFAARHGDLVGLRKAADFLSAAPHAVFRNRFGSIFLTLATKGSSEQCHGAIIDVSTRHGDIAVNLVSKNSKLQLHNVVSYVLKTEFCTSWQTYHTESLFPKR
jgi:hypothetical protein